MGLHQKRLQKMQAESIALQTDREGNHGQAF